MTHSEGITFLGTPTVDKHGTITIGRWGGWLIQIMPMLFSDRLVLTPGTWLAGYDYGWCYPKRGAAHLAAFTWDPETQGEPVGFIKAITHRQRQPGERSSEGGDG